MRRKPHPDASTWDAGAVDWVGPDLRYTAEFAVGNHIQPERTAACGKPPPKSTQ